MGRLGWVALLGWLLRCMVGSGGTCLDLGMVGLCVGSLALMASFTDAPAFWLKCLGKKLLTGAGHQLPQPDAGLHSGLAPRFTGLFTRTETPPHFISEFVSAQAQPQPRLSPGSAQARPLPKS